jgi:hypothetical protein
VSAPSLLDDRGQSRGLPGGGHPDVTFATGYARRTQPGADPLDPLDRLALRLAALCGEAVDPLAIVAGLEAEGHNDRLAQERHGLPDLFALAEELYRRVPRGAHLPARRAAAAPGGRAGTIARPLLRGSLFAVPALCGLALLPSAGSTGMSVRLGIAVIQILAWGYGQGIAHAAYARLNAGDQSAARVLLRQATLCALAGEIGLFCVLALITGSAPSVLLPTATALGYCLAAVPALVLGAELRLAAVLAPVGLATLAWAAGLRMIWGSAGAGIIAGAAVFGTLWLAWWLTRQHVQAGRAWPRWLDPRRVKSAFARIGRLRCRHIRSVRARIGHVCARARRIRTTARIAWPGWGETLRSARTAQPAQVDQVDQVGQTAPTARTTRPDRGRHSSSAARGAGWAAGTIPQALYGSCVGIWLLLVLVGPIGTGSTAQLHAAATLTLSMGAAEWHYAWYRQAMRRSLAANHELGGFARRAVVVWALALTRQALTTALLAGSIYTLLDRHSGAIGCYLFALALSPGLLAATVVRAVAARGLLALTVLALGLTGLVQPVGGALAAAQVACGYAVALAVAAARLSTRPWTNF